MLQRAMAEAGPCAGTELSPQPVLFPDLPQLLQAVLCRICNPNLCKFEDQVSARLVHAAPEGTYSSGRAHPQRGTPECQRASGVGFPESQCFPYLLRVFLHLSPGADYRLKSITEISNFIGPSIKRQ